MTTPTVPVSKAAVHRYSVSDDPSNPPPQRGHSSSDANADGDFFDFNNDRSVKSRKENERERTLRQWERWGKGYTVKIAGWWKSGVSTVKNLGRRFGVQVPLGEGVEEAIQRSLHEELCDACGSGDIDIVNRILDTENVDINELDYNNWTPLLHASHGDHWEIVVLLLKRGARVDCETYFGQTPLIDAARSCSVDVLTTILDSGDMDINCHDKLGQTPLHLACRWNNIPAVELLLQRGADVNAMTLQGDTSLMYACQRGVEDAIPILLKYGADMTIRDMDGATAYDWALRSSYVALAETLKPIQESSPDKVVSIE